MSEAARALDRRDPLRAYRERFRLPDDAIYLCGHSLGPLPRRVPDTVVHGVTSGWGAGAVSSWNDAGWIDLPARLGAAIAPLVGARADRVVVCDSTSLNLFKSAAVALAHRPGRSVILTEPATFPTDRYVIDAMLSWRGGGGELRSVEAADLEKALDGDVAALVLTHVEYRTGRLHDMARLSAAAREVGALTIWDLSHSVGTMPIDLDGARVDLAVGCTYKYLCGGPGAPAFVYVSPELGDTPQPLAGWFGHADPFAFEPDYRPAPGVAAMLTGTPPILSMLALASALEVFADVDLAAVRAKAVALGESFLEGLDAELRQDLGGPLAEGARTMPDSAPIALASPRDPAERSCQISLRCNGGYALARSLRARGVVADFRAPDLVRFGLAPLWVGFEDVERAVRAIAAVLRAREHERPENEPRAKVT